MPCLKAQPKIIDLQNQVADKVTVNLVEGERTALLAQASDYGLKQKGFWVFILSSVYTAFQDPSSSCRKHNQPFFFFFWTASLTCSSDKMRAIISKSYLASFKYRENNLHLNDPTCRPKISNVVEFSFPLDGCGTIKKVKWGTELGFVKCQRCVGWCWQCRAFWWP